MTPGLSVIAAALALSAAPSHTAPTAAAAAAPDPRIRVVSYDPQRIVGLSVPPRTAVQIAFAADEKVEHVALGDSGAWEVAAKGAMVFLKPSASPGPSNMIVVTAAPGGARTYGFELSAPRARQSGAPAYILRFRYPQDEAVRLAAALAAQRGAVEERILGLKLERGAVDGPRNLDYVAQGDAALAPSEVTDNGRFTVLRFPGSQAVPSLFVAGADGQERPAAFDVRGEFVVIHETAPRLILRRGRARLCLINLAWRSASPRPPTATATPQVRRTDKGDRP